MKTEDVLAECEAAGALLKGHFVLSSGRHSDTYLNKSIVSMYPARTETLCKGLATKVRAELKSEIDCVISPAMGGIIFGYETARHLEKPFMFTERVDGDFQLRRGFGVDEGANVLVVEDIVSTGLSARECIEAIRQAGGNVVALACLIDRSGGEVNFDVPFLPLAKFSVESWAPDNLPAHLKDMPVVKPGSRGLTSS